MSYDLFISCSRRDNENGRVTQLVKQISRDFESFAGGRLGVFFDKNDIQGWTIGGRRFSKACASRACSSRGVEFATSVRNGLESR